MWQRVFRKKSRDEDLDEELRFHVETEANQLMERGYSRDEAERRAREMFGNRTLIAEVTREKTGPVWFGRVWQDLRYAARVFRQSPWFSVAAVMSLALGIGASTAVFSIADTVFLRPLPYRDPGRLMWVAIRFPGNGTEFVPSPDFVAWRRDNRTFQELSATQFNCCGAMIMNGTDAAQVFAARVSFNLLASLGVSPMLGRGLTREEELPNGPRGVLLTYPFWRNHFASRKDVAGQSITLDGRSYTVDGVLPESFVFPMDVKVDVLTTLPVDPNASHHDRGMSTWAVFGKLKPGVTLAQARADLQRLFATSKADLPQMFRSDTSLLVEPLQQHRVGNARLLLLVLAGAAGCLLLIACANVAGLLLGRWAARSRELAVRAAIGASRARLVRQLLTETALLTALGCCAGLALTAAALRLFARYAGNQVPRLSEVAMNGRVFGIALLVSGLTVLIFGVLPAVRAGRADIRTVLQQAGRPGLAGGQPALRRGLAVTEVALSCMLLSGAALLLQTLWHMQYSHLGFQAEHLLSITIPQQRPAITVNNWRSIADELLGRLRRLPGTVAAAVAECTPLTAGPIGGTFSRADRPLPEAFHHGDGIAMCGAGPDFFAATGTRLERGRAFTDYDFDHPDTVAILNEAAARAYFPGEDPLGKQILGQQTFWKTVIGVVADSKNNGLGLPATPQAFVNKLPLYAGSDLHFVVRQLGDERAVESAIRAELRSAVPGVFAKIETLDQAIGRMTTAPRFNGMLLASFAGIAFLMAMIGVYGVLAFGVAQRTQEIGIRIALGARPRQVLALVLREGALLMGIGSVAGVCGTLALTRYMKGLLYEVSPTDPRTYAAVVLALGIAGAVATCLPARRAASVDPTLALRHD
jgi:putative ABC transport system permease protein